MVAVLVLVAAACSSQDGRTLAEPDPDLTLTTPPTTAPSTTLAPFLSLKSPALVADAPMPTRFTCDGPDVSPPLEIDAVPAGTQSLTIALTDPDADNFVHWAITGIDPSVRTVSAGEVPDGAVVYANDFGNDTYNGPCPDDGELHNYVFTVYALPPIAVALVGPDDTNGAGVIDAVSRLASATAALTASYQSDG